MPIEQVLQRHSEWLASLPGVVATGQGFCDHVPCIKVYVVAKTAALLEKLPSQLDGYPLVVEESGDIRAL